MTREMIAEDTSPTPLDLWNKGIEKIGGSLRHESREILCLNLLTPGKAVVTQFGIIFNDVGIPHEKWSRRKGDTLK